MRTKKDKTTTAAAPEAPKAPVIENSKDFDETKPAFDWHRIRFDDTVKSMVVGWRYVLVTDDGKNTIVVTETTGDKHKMSRRVFDALPKGKITRNNREPKTPTPAPAKAARKRAAATTTDENAAPKATRDGTDGCGLGAAETSRLSWSTRVPTTRTTGASIMEKTIQTRAVLVNLRLTGWTARARDEDASREVIARASAASGVAKVMKQLVAKSEVKALETATMRVRRTHYELTLPWDDSGKRLLPINMHDRYRDTMDDLMAKRERALKRFLTRYDAAKTTARQELGSLYDETDYPTKEKIERKFKAVYEFTPVPSSGHFVADMADADAAKIRDSIDAGVKARVDGAITDVYRRLGDAIQHIAEKLAPGDDGKPRIFRDSLLGNLNELLDLMGPLNVANDPTLDKLRDKVRAIVKDVTPDMLRASPKNKAYDAATHQKVQDDFNNLAKQFAGYFGDTKK